MKKVNVVAFYPRTLKLSARKVSANKLEVGFNIVFNSSIYQIKRINITNEGVRIVADGNYLICMNQAKYINTLAPDTLVDVLDSQKYAHVETRKIASHNKKRG